VDSLQVPQVIGLSPEAAYSAIVQAGFVPLFAVQAQPGQPLSGVATQWGQVPLTFAGQSSSVAVPMGQVVAQSPAAGAWAPRHSVVHAQWVEVAPAVPPVLHRRESYAGWIVAAVLTVLLIVGAVAWLVTGGGMPEPVATATPTSGSTQSAPVTP
jgi:hypothetical protein